MRSMKRNVRRIINRRNPFHTTTLNLSTHSLFDAVKLGAFQMKNRFVVSPLTRVRADANTFAPNDLLTEYYSQRAGFGLIITECSQISTLSNAIHCNSFISVMPVRIAFVLI